MFSYALNGGELKVQGEKDGIYNPMFVKKDACTELLVYGTVGRQIVIRKLPYFDIVTRYVVEKDKQWQNPKAKARPLCLSYDC